MKTFYTERDIEDMAAAGATEIRIDDSVVLTDVARDRARYLGLHIREDAGDLYLWPSGDSLRASPSSHKKAPEEGRPSPKSAPLDPESEKAVDLETGPVSTTESGSEKSPLSEKIDTLDPETLERIRAAVKELLPLIL